MRTTLTRMVLATTLSTALVATAVPAGAAETEIGGVANGLGVHLSVLDTVTLNGGVSESFVTTGPVGEAMGVGLDLLDQTLSVVDQTAATAYDPADPAERNCLLPDEPADLGLPVSGVVLGVICSSAEVVSGAHAQGEGEIVGLDLDGTVLSDLVAFLIDAVGADVAAGIDSALEPLEDTAGPMLEPVVTPLAEQCEAGLEQLLGALSPALDGVQDLAEQDPSGIIAALQDQVLVTAVEALGAFPEACNALLTLLLDPPSLQVVLATISDALTAAFEGLDLVEVSVGGSTSVVDATPETVVAEAGTLAAGVELPSLGALLDAIDVIVSDLVGDLVGQTAGSVGDSFDDLVPTVEALLQPVLDALMLPDLLTATDPLAVIEVLPSQAIATLDRATGDVTTSGKAVVVEVTLSSAFAALTGEESTEITIPGGQSQTLFADTPLESTIAVATVEPLERERAGITMTGTRAVGAELDLLTGVNGGIGLTIDAAEATVGAAAAAEPAPAPEPEGGELPTTGGGMAVLALLSLAGAAALRRRN